MNFQLNEKVKIADADKTLELFKELHGKDNKLAGMYSANDIILFLESQPFEDVREVAHGKWEKSLFAQAFSRCSECGAVWNRKFEYCPHCGAKMDGEENEE